MASVYILYSKKLDKFYIGSCKDLAVRIDQHISKKFATSFTSKVNDWELFISKDDLDYEQARLIESHIKKMKSKTYIQNLKKHPEILETLIRKIVYK